MYLALETSDGLSDMYGYQEIMKKPIKTPDETAALIDAVSGDEVEHLANEIFRDTALNVSLVG